MLRSEAPPLSAALSSEGAEVELQSSPHSNGVRQAAYVKDVEDARMGGQSVGDARIEEDDDLQFEDAGLATMTSPAERASEIAKTSPPSLSSITIDTPGVDRSSSDYTRVAANKKRVEDARMGGQSVGDARIEEDDDLQFEDAGLATMTSPAERASEIAKTSPPSLSSITIDTPGVDRSSSDYTRVAANKKRMLAVAAAQTKKVSPPAQRFAAAAESLIDGDAAIGLTGTELAELGLLQSSSQAAATSSNPFFGQAAASNGSAMPQPTLPTAVVQPQTMVPAPPRIDGDVPIGMTQEEFEMLAELRRVSDAATTPESGAPSGPPLLGSPGSTEDDDLERMKTFAKATSYAQREQGAQHEQGDE